MIVELVMDLLFGLAGLVVDLIPNVPVPAWLDNAGGYFDTIWDAGAGMGAWVPWTLLGTVTAAVGTVLLVSFTIFVVRFVVTLVTGGGAQA